MSIAFISGITGQDGSYLTELLLKKGYEVHGLARRASTMNTDRLALISNDKFHLHYGDLSDAASIFKLIGSIKPDEIYHLGAQSHVSVSFEMPEYTSDVTGSGTVRLLEAMKQCCPKARFYQAGSSEMFGMVRQTPQNENTPFYPRSPYAAAKAYAHWITVNYRESYKLHASNGMLFNHESPRRGETFVTRKITRAAARINAGLQEKLYLGNLDAKRDWGYAPEYVEAMWLMLQQETPEDYVIATGQAHTVKEFVEECFGHLGLEWQKYVEIDPQYLRPAEVDLLIGDATKAKKQLGWEPKVTFKELVRIMTQADVELLKNHVALR